MERTREGNGFLQAMLAMVFSISFFVYFLDFSEAQLAIPVGAFCLIGLGLAIHGLARNALQGGYFAVSRPTAAAVMALCIPIVVSAFDAQKMALLYGLALIASVISARVILGYLSLQEVLLAFFYSALISSAVFFIVGYEVISGSALEQVRLNLFSFHPNLIGFIFGAYAVAAVFATLLRKSWIAGTFLAVSLAIIFLASSRGSLVAVGAAAFVGLVMVFARGLTWRRFVVISAWGATGALTLLVVAVVVGIVLPQLSDLVISYLGSVLDITNKYRGLDTGLTGRIENWRTTIAAIDGGRWLTGHGYRTSAADLGFSVDNGYLTLIYETGIVVSSVIFFLYANTTVRLVHAYWRSASVQESVVLLAGIGFMVYFLMNNLVARYLLGIGNPVSLLALFFLVRHAADVEQTQVNRERSYETS